MRQAHRSVRHTDGIRLRPAWVVGGLVAAALLFGGIATGSTGGAITAIRSSGAPQSQVLGAVSSLAVAPIDTADQASVDTSRGGPQAASHGGGRMVATTAMHNATAPAIVAAVSRASATPHPPAPAHANSAARQTVPHVKKAAARASAAPRPRPVRTQKPAIHVYRDTERGLATWGHFGGTVITRLPPGTHIRVCSTLGCWEGVSAGYGPAPGGGHLVDLDAAVFRLVCGPLAIGVGPIVLRWR